MNRSSSWHSALSLALAVLVLVPIVVGTAWYWDYSQDDVYITYRYSRNVATGQGFVFNPGESVQGTTTPLFTLLMAGLYLITPDLVHAGNLVSALSLAGTVLLALSLGRRMDGDWLGVGTALMLAFNPWFYISFGMETLTYTLLLMAGFWFASRDRELEAGACAGLLAVTRADGVLLAPVLGLAAMIVRRRLPWQGALVASLIAGAWYVYAWATFGTPIPQTFDAKANLLGGWTFVRDGFEWYRQLFVNGSFLYILAPLLWVVGVVASLRRRSPVSLLWTWSLIYVIGYSLLNVSAFWYFAPLLPAVVLTTGYGARAVWSWMAAWVRARSVRQAVAALTMIALLGGQMRTARAFSDTPKRVETYRLVGEWLAVHTPADSLVLVGDLGVVSWYSHRPTIDTFGLVVPGMYHHSETYAILKYRPDYVVATQYWAWKAVEGQDWLLRDYRPVAQFSTPGDNEFSPMTVYQRRFPLPEFDAEFRWGQWGVRAGLPVDSAEWGDPLPIVLWSDAPRGSSVGFDWPVCVLGDATGIIASARVPFLGGEYPAEDSLGPEEIADVVWLTLSQGSRAERAEVWLGRNCGHPDQLLGTITLEPPSPLVAGEWAFGRRLELNGLTPGVGPYWPGGEVPIKLYWEAVSMMNAEYSVFVHLLDEDGRLAAQSDGWPGGRPTSELHPGEMVIDTRALMLPPDLPAGQYHILIGVYDPVSGSRELLPNGWDSLLLPQAIRVAWPGGSGRP